MLSTNDPDLIGYPHGEKKRIFTFLILLHNIIISSRWMSNLKGNTKAWTLPKRKYSVILLKLVVGYDFIG